MMRSLRWTFWLAMLIAALGTFATSTLLMSQWHRFESFSDAQQRPNARLQTLAQDIEHVLHNRTALSVLLRNNSMSEFGEVFLIDPTGADVLERPIPAEIMGSAPDAPDGHADPVPPSSGPPIFARAIRAGDGTLYFMIFLFDLPQHPIWALFRWFGLTWVLIAALVISGLVSAWLAHIVVRPIQHLAAASSRQGDGDLDTVIDGKLLQRRDEIGALSRQLGASAHSIKHLMLQHREFLRDVSHEVRTPLARLQLAAETVELDPTDTRALQQIQREVEVIDDLVQDLLHLSQLDHAQLDHAMSRPEFHPLHLQPLLQARIESIRLLASRKQITLQTDFDAAPLHLRGAPALLERAVDNLLANAVRHAPPASTIRLLARTVNDACEIQVVDQGPGVPASSLEIIFDPFVRIDASRQRLTGGFGLGLSLVRRIVELHGGKVCARNVEPGGLAVRMMLPIEGELCVA